MKLNNIWKKNLESNIVTESMLGEVIHSYNKRAKNMRDKEGAYHYCRYGYSNQYSEKKKLYYSRKDELLRFATPCAVHIVERVRKRRYEPDRRFEEYYLLYKVGDYTFHAPINNPSDYKLPIVNIGDLETHGLSTDQLISVQTCEKVYKGLNDGSLKYVNEVEQ